MEPTGSIPSIQFLAGLFFHLIPGLQREIEMSDNNAIKKGFEEYNAGVEKSIAKFPERKKDFVTGSNAQIGRASCRETV